MLERAAVTYVTRCEGCLAMGGSGAGLEQGAQSFQVLHDDLARVYIEQAFCLQAHEIAGDEFAHGAQLIGQFLMTAGEEELRATRSFFAFRLRKLHENGDQPLANGGEGELFDNADEATEASPDHGEHLQRDLRMLDTEGVKITARDKSHFGVFNGDGRGRIGAAIEDRQLGDALTGTIDGEDLLATVDGCFEDAHLAAGNDVKAGARLALREEQFAGGEELAHGAAGQGSQFFRGEAREQRGAGKHGGKFDTGKVHSGILATATLVTADRRRRWFDVSSFDTFPCQLSRD